MSSLPPTPALKTFKESTMFSLSIILLSASITNIDSVGIKRSLVSRPYSSDKTTLVLIDKNSCLRGLKMIMYI